MNLFACEDNVLKWSQADPESGEGIRPLADWATLFSADLFRRRLDPDYFEKMADYRKQMVNWDDRPLVHAPARLVELLHGWRRPDCLSESTVGQSVLVSGLRTASDGYQDGVIAVSTRELNVDSGSYIYWETCGHRNRTSRRARQRRGG